nr:ATP-binding protein [Tolypothrix sp. FACHB-123]
MYHTAVTRDENSVMVQIADNDIGISQEIQQRIFDNFFTTKPVGKGTGLGLAIVYQIIVEKHGVTLEVNSSLGEVSKFTLTIPTQ